MNLLDYPGGKSAVVRRLINLIPPHEVYIESHLGGGALLRHKRPARLNIGIDRDASVIAAWQALIAGSGAAAGSLFLASLPGGLAARVEDTDGDIAIDDDRPQQPSLFVPMLSGDASCSRIENSDSSGVAYRAAHVTNSDGLEDHATNGDARPSDVDRTQRVPAYTISDDAGHEFTFLHADSAAWMRRRRWTGREFVYADPPYLFSTRSAGRAYYRCEYTEADHVRLLNVLRCLPCPVMISGYWSELYADMLARWHTVSFQARTHTYTSTEFLWMNYAPPTRLHEYTFLGDGFRERERIKRKISRWKAKLERMDTLERQALLAALQEADL